MWCAPSWRTTWCPRRSTPFKAYYAEAMFRGERPQKGRLRQFHQVGIEWLGAPDPAADAECIIMLMEFYKRLGFDLSKLRLLINSMGDAQCRPAYREQVKQFILDHADEMCDECHERASSIRCAPSTARTTTAARSWPTHR